MITSSFVGFVLVGLSAVLLAAHWHRWRRKSCLSGNALREKFERRQLLRRSFASSLVGMLGAALAAYDVVPRDPSLLTLYLLVLLAVTGWILCLGVIDFFSTQRFYQHDAIDRIAHEVRETKLSGMIKESLKS